MGEGDGLKPLAQARPLHTGGPGRAARRSWPPPWGAGGAGGSLCLRLQGCRCILEFAGGLGQLDLS